jgi:hypothetical protein
MQNHDPGLDLGVHLTLTSEKRHYRWRPLTRPSRAAGLTDPDGYFWRTVAELRRSAHHEAVEAELRAQVDAALAAGVDVTHLDDHMGAVLCPEYVDLYVGLGRDYRLPVVIVDTLESYDPRHNLADSGRDGALQRAAIVAVSDGSPRFEAVLETPWQRVDSVEADYLRLFRRAPQGLSFFALHFTAPGELEAIEPATAQIRTDEYALFRSGFLRDLMESGDFILKGMREFRDALRHDQRRMSAATAQSLSS